MPRIAIALRVLPFLLFGAGLNGAAAAVPFALEDVFSLEYAEDPRISPEGNVIIYVRNRMDRMTDQVKSSLWIVNADRGNHRPLVTGFDKVSQPRWSPDGDRVAWVGTQEGETAIWIRWMDTGLAAAVSRPAGRPENLSWSPDGNLIAFTMHVPAAAEPLVAAPRKPAGAEWADPVEVIDTMVYRADGKGFLEAGHHHVFVVPAEGGTPRQLTQGPFNHIGEPSWLIDSSALVISANRRDDWEHERLDSDLWQVRIRDGSMQRLTTRYGPDRHPAVSPDGSRIAFTGFDDDHSGYRNERLYVLERRTGEVTVLTPDLDAGVRQPAWDRRGRGIYFLHDREGQTHLARLELGTGAITSLADDVGGTYISRPYASGSFTVAGWGSYAYTMTGPDFPAEVASGDGRRTRRLTRLNDDLLPFRSLGRVESFTTRSSHDQREIQAWVIYPPGFDRTRRWPMILEIHGGPFANYGPRFSAEMQLYAAAGYVVLYVNPRGSTGYGEDFARLIDKNYPGEDYYDLMSAVDAVLARGYVDPDRLYVTGGSGGGVLTAWIVGKTDRFRAAAVVKPVVNWTSFVLTADNYPLYFYRYFFSGPPWEQPEEYWRRSPLSLVANVKTPTMVLSGDQDFRTPISEAEQYYQALRLNNVDSVLVRVPGAPHHIAGRPTHLIATVANILAWFERYGSPREPPLLPVEAPEAVSEEPEDASEEAAEAASEEPEAAASEPPTGGD